MLAARIPDGRTSTAAAITGSLALLVAAAVHLAQYVSIFHAVPWIGPLFVADAAASTVLAIAILTTRRRIAAASGALLAAGALLGLVVSSSPSGLLGWHEEVLRPSIRLAIGSELLAVAALAPLALAEPMRRSGRLTARALAGTGLAAIAVLHLAAAGEEWDDARPVFWLFVGLAAASLALAVRLAQGLDRWSWHAVVALAAVPLAGYFVSRSTGLPGDTGDVGDWANVLGLATLGVEAALMAASFGRTTLSLSTEATMQSPTVTEITRLSAHRRPDGEPPQVRPVRDWARRAGSGPRPAQSER